MKWLIFILLMSCAKAPEQTSVEDAPGGVPTPVPSVRFCRDDFACAQACNTTYPYQNPNDIRAECQRRGILNSGICNGMLSDNAELYPFWIACLDGQI